jgi:[acyl-carrier-protein] S-malonyltransferase
LLGIVFPGQGSQSIGMLADLAPHFPIIEQTFAEASAILEYDLWRVSQFGPQESLDNTECTQPALLAAGYAIWQILRDKLNTREVILAGHSLGEYTALVCADAISFAAGIKLVAARGKFMQVAVPAGQGALAAIVGLDNAAVQALCQQAALTETLTPANYNSPGQVVIAGNVAAVNRALLLAKEMGAKIAKILPVSVPSHCALMKPAAVKLQEVLADITISPPKFKIINNADVAIYSSGADIMDGLLRQLYSPVRWVEIIEKFAQYQVTAIIECGPGKVLSGLNKRILPALTYAHTADLPGLQNVLSVVLSS